MMVVVNVMVLMLPAIRLAPSVPVPRAIFRIVKRSSVVLGGGLRGVVRGRVVVIRRDRGRLRLLLRVASYPLVRGWELAGDADGQGGAGCCCRDQDQHDAPSFAANLSSASILSASTLSIRPSISRRSPRHASNAWYRCTPHRSGSAYPVLSS